MRILKLFSLIGIIIFVYILMNANLGEIVSLIYNINPVFLVLVFIFMFPVLIIKVFKWYILLRTYKIRYPFWKLFKAWMMGFSISLITPARLGDFSRAYYIRDVTSVGKALTTVIIDRLIDVFLLFILAIFGMLSFFTLYSGYLDIITLFFVVFVVFLLGVYALTKKSFMEFVFKNFFYRIIPKKHKNDMKFTFDEFYKGMSILNNNKRSLLVASLLGIPIWLFSILHLYLISSSLGIELSFIFMLSVLPIISLLDIIPISFSGIGTRDAALIFFLSFVSLSEYAIPISLIFFFSGYIVPGFIGMAFILREGYKIDG